MHLHDEILLKGLFDYKVFRGNKLVQKGVGHNSVVRTGRHAMLECFLRQQNAPTRWYAGIYTGTYVTNDAETAGSIASATSEFTSYDGDRAAWFPQPGLDDPISSNSETPAVYSITTPATLKGAFLIDSYDKGGANGLLFSVANFDTPADVVAEDIFLLYYTVLLSVAV